MNLFFKEITMYGCSLILGVVLLFGCNITPSVMAERGSMDTLDEFEESMSRIKTGFERLLHDDLRTYSAVDLIVEGDLHNGLVEVERIIRERIRLEDELLYSIGDAEEKYSEIAGTYMSEWDNQRQQMAEDYEKNLNLAIDDMNREVDRFSEVFDVERFDKFDHMAGDMTKLITAVKNQRVDVDLEISFFEQLRSMVSLSRSVDMTQLIFVCHYMRSPGLPDIKSDLHRISSIMSDIDMVDFIDIFQEQSLEGGSLSTALEHTFEESVVPYIPIQEVLPAIDTFSISIRPDRGTGGIYHEGENVFLTVQASHDCWFILRSRNSSGREKQLVPNEYFKEANFLRKNTPLVIPSEAMDFDFIAKNPPEIEVIELVATKNKIVFVQDFDRMDQGKYKGPSKLEADLKYRDIEIQPRHSSFVRGGGFSHQFYNPEEAGNALIVSTFIRIVEERI